MRVLASYLLHEFWLHGRVYTSLWYSLDTIAAFNIVNDFVLDIIANVTSSKKKACYNKFYDATIKTLLASHKAPADALTHGTFDSEVQRIHEALAKVVIDPPKEEPCAQAAGQDRCKWQCWWWW